MALDLDPIYYTETMVKILREQSHSQLAMELAELILKQNPENSGVSQLLREIKEESRKTFERFKNSGRTQEPHESEPSVESSQANAPELPVEADSPILSDSAVPHLTVVETVVSEEKAEAPPPSARQRKIKLLEKLLNRVEQNRA